MLDPVLLFFLLGVTAGLLRSELRLPAAVYDLVSMLLLLAIGLKGGIELARQPFGELALQALAVIAMGALLPLLASFLGFGLLLALTPCIFPMIPILSGIIVNHGHAVTHARAFWLSLAYVLVNLAVDLAYTLFDPRIRY